MSETVTTGHLFKSLGHDFFIPAFSFCEERRYQEILKQIPEEMQGAEAPPLVDCQYLHALLKENDGLHIYKDVMKMSFESTAMAMATEMEMSVLLVISHEADQKSQQRKTNAKSPLDYLSLVNLHNKFGMVRDLEKQLFITQN